MAEYKAIHGTLFQHKTSDPLAAGIDNATWASGGALNTARSELAGAGVQTAAIAFGGLVYPPRVANNELYDGSSWTEVGDLNTARSTHTGIGLSTAALAVGGQSPTAVVAITESWNGSSWTEVGDLNSGRQNMTGSGTTPAALIFGGNDGSNRGYTETWNGSAWTEAGDLNTARSDLAGATNGTTTATLAFGGGTNPKTQNESWNGSAWTELGDLNTGRQNLGGGGVQTAALAFAGETVAITESWDGSSWTEVADLSTARYDLNTGGGGASSSLALAFGGNAPGGKQTATEEFTAATITDAILNDGQVFYRSDTGDFKVSLTQYGTGAWATGGSMPSGRSARPTGAGTQTASVVFGGNPAGNVTLTYNGTAFATPGNNLNDGRYNSAGLGTSTAAFNVSGVPTSLPDLSVAVESWNGTSWTEIAEVNTGRDSLSAAANSTTSAALVFGGNNPSVTGITELWDGSSWTEVADMNTARKKSGGFGTSTSAIAAGGYISTNSNAVESWDGTSWTEVAECTAKDNCGASGVSGVLGQIFGGSPFVAVTQQWDGSSWTEVADLATARDQLGGTGNSTVTALAFGGRTPGGAVANTEEWTVPESISNLTITD